MTELKPVKGVVIRPDGTHEEKVFRQLSDYQEAVGGWIDAIRLYDYNATEIGNLYLDDEGLLKSQPLNPMASAISYLLGNTPHLVGSVILVGKSDGEGYDTDIPDYLLTLIQNISAKQEKEA